MGRRYRWLRVAFISEYLDISIVGRTPGFFRDTRLVECFCFLGFFLITFSDF